MTMAYKTPKGLKHTARLFCKASSPEYKDGWDRLFGKKKPAKRKAKKK